MFRASSAYFQEDTVVHMQYMVLSLSIRVLGGLSVHSLSVSCVPTGHQDDDDEHTRLETYRGEYYFMNK